MNRQDKLGAEIEAQEKKIFQRNPGAQAPAPRAKEELEDDQLNDSAESHDQDDAIGDDAAATDDDSTAAKDAQKPEDWETRFKSFKQVADTTIRGLRQEKLFLQEDIQSLKKQMKELAGKIQSAQTQHLDITGLFSDEERNLIGEETIKGIEKAVTSAIDANVKPLKSELEKEREQREIDQSRQIETERARTNAEFLSRLGDLVPNYKKIDHDPEFIKWMNQPDTVSGSIRANLFKNAQRIGDVHRVAEFFSEYAKLTEAPKNKEKMEKKITPSNTPVTPKTPNDKQKHGKLNMRAIEKFYDDVSRGRYRNRQKEQQEMERRIDAALRKTGLGRR